MNRRALLAYAPAVALTGSRVRAQPLPVVSDVVPPGTRPGPLSSAGAPTLNLDFMSTPGTLDPRITFTRASTATYSNSAGVMQTAAISAPRWDYNPSTLALNGLLIEEARTNLAQQSANASLWAPGGGTVAPPTITANQAVAPDGTSTAARVVYPAVPSAGNFSAVNLIPNPFTATVAPYSISVWMKGNVGGERLYICATPDGSTYYRSSITLTTSWQRYVLSTPNLTAASWYVEFGTDLRDAGQTATLAQTVFMWGAQIEQGAFPTSYIATAAASVTRSADLASMPTGTWFNTTNGTYQAEFIPNGNAAGLPIVISGNAGSPTLATGADSKLTAGIRSGAAVFSATGPLLTFGAVNKAAFGYLSGASTAAVNGTTIGPSATALSVTGTTVEFGSDGVTPGNNALDGWLRRVRYWPRVLSSFELQSVTR